MFIQPHQLPMIMSPKKGCQRGLEEYIVEQHWGDKKLYHQSGTPKRDISAEDPAYMYLNNPIYRVGKAGDPAPNGLSSRHIYQLGDYEGALTETQSALHLLYPTIDEGSQFAYEKPWDMEWYYSRSNIPNVAATPEEVDIDATKTREYDDFVEKRRVSNKISDWMRRPLPIYDQQRVADELLPDGVRQIDLDGILNQRAIPMVDNTTDVHQVLGNVPDDNKNVENYTGPTKSSRTGGNLSAGLGAYGYPQPHGYAQVGKDYRKYDVFPGYVPGINVEYFEGLSKNTTNNLMWLALIAFMVGIFVVVNKK